MNSALARACQRCFSLARTQPIPALFQSHRTSTQTYTPFSTFQPTKEAFLRPGPGREMFSSSSTLKRSSQKTIPSTSTGTSLSPSELEAASDFLSIDKYVQDQENETDDHLQVLGSRSLEPTPSTPLITTVNSNNNKPSVTDLPTYKEIILLETDFRERFIKGGGNGGQKINKTNSNVELKHYETGIVVQCQETRSLPQNRKLARRILIGRLDEYYNGEMSKRGQKAEKIRKQKSRMARKASKKYHGVSKDGGAGDQDDGDGDEGDGDSEGEDIDVKSMTLEEVLASDNKKPSRRKAGRKDGSN